MLCSPVGRLPFYGCYVSPVSGLLYYEVETVQEFTCLDDIVSASGGCEAAVTAKRICGWVEFWECRELLYGRRFPLRLKGAFYM